MLHYAQHLVPSWYHYVNGTLGMMTRNGGLYLVTGADKASNWCLASYSNGSVETNILRFSTDIDDTSATEEFLWESSGPVDARTCPVSGKEGNQCVFLRGFKLALDEKLYKTCFASPPRTSDIRMSRPWWGSILSAIIPRWFLDWEPEQTSTVVSDVTNNEDPVSVVESFPKSSEVTISAPSRVSIY
jgi:hypothetical protein